MTIHYRPDALREAEQAVGYYRAISPGLAERFLRALDDAVARIVQNSDAWVQLNNGVRRVLLAGFPYALVYRVEANEIIVYAVAHQRRRPGYWRRRLLR